MREERIILELDFKRSMMDLRKFLQEEFPEMLTRLVSCWKVSATRWRCEFKKRTKDDK